MFGYVSSESSSVDSDAAQTAEAVPWSHRPLTTVTKPSPESSAITNSLQSTVETPHTPGQLIPVHVLQVPTTLYGFIRMDGFIGMTC